MEEYADTMDMDCMMDTMTGFFTCLDNDCNVEGNWVDCNAQVEDSMMECF